MGFLKKFQDKVRAPNCRVELKLDNYSLSLGEKLQGSLELQSGENFEATEIRCIIECVETSKIIKYVYDPSVKRSLPRLVTESSIAFVANPILSGKTSFGVGENRTYPVNFIIPSGSKPSVQGVDNRVVWTIKGVVAVDGRPDINTNCSELQVLPVSPSAVGPQVVKEVVREVVKIPCRYCQTLFDQLDTSCPNCGAKRTI